MNGGPYGLGCFLSWLESPCPRSSGTVCSTDFLRVISKKRVIECGISGEELTRSSKICNIYLSTSAGIVGQCNHICQGALSCLM